MFPQTTVDVSASTTVRCDVSPAHSETRASSTHPWNKNYCHSIVHHSLQFLYLPFKVLQSYIYRLEVGTQLTPRSAIIITEKANQIQCFTNEVCMNNVGGRKETRSVTYIQLLPLTRSSPERRPISAPRNAHILMPGRLGEVNTTREGKTYNFQRKPLTHSSRAQWLQLARERERALDSRSGRYGTARRGAGG